MPRLLHLIASIVLFFAFACTTTENTQEKEPTEGGKVSEIQEMPETGEMGLSEEETPVYVDPSEVRGFSTPEELATYILKAMQNEDFMAYAQYVIPMGRITELAEQIEDTKIRKLFVNEMAFSHKEEKDYFVNMIGKLKDDKVKLDSIPLGEVLSFEFKKGLYQPLELQEILIDIELPGKEEVLIFVAIKDQGKWYATSELEL